MLKERMIWWARERKKNQKASIKQKVDYLKIGKSYARLLIKKEKAQRKLKSQKNTEMLQFKYRRYCEYIYANQVQNSQETDPLLQKWNLPKWLCRNNTLNSKHIITKSYPDNDGCTTLWMRLTPLNCMIKKGYMANFMLYILYHNFFKM